MMSKNREHKTDVSSLWSFMAKVIEQLNDMVPSRVDA